VAGRDRIRRAAGGIADSVAVAIDGHKAQAQSDREGRISAKRVGYVFWAGSAFDRFLLAIRLPLLGDAVALLKIAATAEIRAGRAAQSA
jgi:hypothetical protein